MIESEKQPFKIFGTRFQIRSLVRAVAHQGHKLKIFKDLKQGKVYKIKFNIFARTQLLTHGTQNLRLIKKLVIFILYTCHFEEGCFL